MGSSRMRKYIINILDQFRKDVNETHAHAYDDLNYIRSGSNGRNSTSESIASSSMDADEAESDDATTPSYGELQTMHKIGASTRVQSGVKFNRLDSSYDFI